MMGNHLGNKSHNLAGLLERNFCLGLPLVVLQQLIVSVNEGSLTAVIMVYNPCVYILHN